MADRIQKWLWQKLFPDSNSIVDTLKASGQDSSFEARSKLAAQSWIENYTWTADQNLKLLSVIRNRSNTNTTGTNDTSSINTNVSTGTNLSTWQNVDDTTLAISQDKATYGVDPAVDNLIASQYANAEDQKYASYVDKIGMETGIYADIQNIDTQVLETYKILWMSDQDIFSRQDISPEEKIAMSNQRKNIASNKINQLRKLQQAKQNEIKELADYEAKKAEAQQAEYKASMDYLKQVNEANKYNLDLAKFELEVGKAQAKSELDIAKYELDVSKYEQTKYDKYFKGINNTTLLDVPDGTILKTRLTDVTNPNGWKECGEYVNDVMAGSIPRFWDTYTDKLNVANEEYWTIWAAAVWNPGNTQYGHVWIIVWAEGDNWIIKSSNLRNDGAISTDLVPKSDIAWYRNTNVKESWDKNVEFTTAFDYLNSTIPNVAKLITPETWSAILISDMQEGNMPKEKIKQLAQLWKVSQDLVDDYTSIRYANQFWSTLSDDDIVSELKAIKWDSLTDEDKLTNLVELELAGKLNNWDWELFEGWWLDIDEAWFNALQDHFDDLNDSIQEAKNIATKIREKYNLN